MGIALQASRSVVDGFTRGTYASSTVRRNVAKRAAGLVTGMPIARRSTNVDEKTNDGKVFTIPLADRRLTSLRFNGLILLQPVIDDKKQGV